MRPKIFHLLLISFLCPVGLLHAESASSITLQNAVDEALKNSPQVQKAESSYKESSWRRTSSFSTYLPTIQFEANYLTQHKYAFLDINLGQPVSVPQVIPTSILALNAKWGLFDGFAATNRYRSTREFESAEENNYHWVQFQTSRNVALLFYKALGAKILKQVAEQNVKTLQDHLNDVVQFRKAGASTKFDVLRVEVQVSEVHSELLNAQDNLVLSQNRLTEALGRESDDRLPQGELPVLSAELAKKATLDSASKRADLVALESRTKGLDDLERASGRFWSPRVSLFGQYQQYNNRNDDFKDWSNYREAYNVGVNLTWDLFDGFRGYSESRVTAEQHYQAERQLKMAQLHSKQDFELWRRKFIYFCSVYQARLSDVEKSEESVRLAKEGRRVGARTNTDLLDAESELFRARAGLVNAQIGSIEALINLELTTGQKLYDYK
jgi:outer membrane protein TolC